MPTSRLLYPLTKLLNDGSGETSSRYPLTAVTAVQFAIKLLLVTFVAAFAVGGGGGTARS